MYFRDRIDAAGQLADALAKWRGHRPLIAAVPRGAVPMGRVIAQRLDGDLDVVLTCKLHAPGNPEFAIGAVDETGWVYVADHAEQAGATSAYLQAQTVDELATIRRRRAQYTPNRPPIDPAGRIVIVVDDGLATGATMIAALHALRERKPARLICAVPVASHDAVEKVGRYADEVVALRTPDVFFAVGQFYMTFGQVDDSEVIEVLRAAAERPAGAVPAGPSPVPDAGGDR